MIDTLRQIRDMEYNTHFLRVGDNPHPKRLTHAIIYIPAEIVYVLEFVYIQPTASGYELTQYGIGYLAGWEAAQK